MSDSARTFHVSPEQAQKTLSAALRGWLEALTWGEARNLLKTRRILVNGNLCQDAGRRLKTTDVVKVLPHSTAPLPKADDIRIRYLDPHLVIVRDRQRP